MKNKPKKLFNNITFDTDDVIACDDETEKNNKEPECVFVDDENNELEYKIKRLFSIKK